MSDLPVDEHGPEEWLRRAESSLAQARCGYNVPGVMLDDLCFDAQQAAEKALKALLIARRCTFPRTHAVAHLLTLLEQCGLAVPETVRRAAALTAYAVRARYPGGPSVTDEDFRAALDVAAEVVKWVAVRLSETPGGPITGPSSAP